MKRIAIYIVCFTFSIFSTYSQIVNISDENFKKALIGQGIDTNNDGEIQKNEAVEVDSIIIINKEIDSLSGIEAFTNITKLKCDSNKLKTIDVSQNTLLTYLSCSENNITGINISKNIALETLICSENYIHELDIYKNEDLVFLNCKFCGITNLDISKNLRLEKLDCSINELKNIELSNNINQKNYIVVMTNLVN